MQTVPDDQTADRNVNKKSPQTIYRINNLSGRQFIVTTYPKTTFAVQPYIINESII